MGIRAERGVADREYPLKWKKGGAHQTRVRGIPSVLEFDVRREKACFPSGSNPARQLSREPKSRSCRHDPLPRSMTESTIRTAHEDQSREGTSQRQAARLLGT